MSDQSTASAGNNLADLLITEAPAAFADFARKHNALVRLLASVQGLKLSALNGYVDPAYLSQYAPVQSVAGKTGAVTLEAVDITDFDTAAAAAAPVQSVNGETGAVVITAADISDFDTAAVAAVLPITSADVTDFDAAAVAAVLPITPSDVTGFNTAAAAAAPVQSVAGKTGAVTLDSGDLTDVTIVTGVETCDSGTIDILTV